ncbi:HAD family acid phosphatase [Dactylosporangium sp. NPDC000244]|uniref:phosphatase domain-containing protein n=1 Tax=Dactylosporangium sp. NPDC000244 TaxID=3154365 RepID=UPI003327A690
MKPAEARPAAVIIDIDGTVANCRHRQHLVTGETPNWEAFFASAALDESLPEGVAVANEHALDSTVIWLTGRPERYRQLTASWLAAQGLPTANLHMRADDDMRPAAIYKVERLGQLRGSFDIVLIIDDDDLVVTSLRQAGWLVQHAQWMAR